MRKIIALIISLALCLSLTAALAEQTITVTGTGETLVSADTAIVSVGVNVRRPTAPAAQSAANEVIAAVRAALTVAGFSEEDINTGFINLYGVYDYTKDVEEIVAYNASSTLAIKVTEMDSAGMLIDEAFAAGANTLNGISFSASDTRAAKEESLKKAVADAKAKAEVLAEAAGLKITGIEIISEGSVYTYDNNVGNVFDAKRLTEESAGTIVQSAKLLVSASVSITFTAE